MSFLALGELFCRAPLLKVSAIGELQERTET